MADIYNYLGLPGLSGDSTGTPSTTTSVGFTPGATTIPVNYSSPATNNFGTQPSGDVLGTTDTAPAPSGGGGSAGPDLTNPVKKDDYARSQGFDNWDHMQNSLGEQPLGQANIDYDAAFSEAFQALEQQEAAAKSASLADIGAAETESGIQTTGLEQEQERRLADFGSQREREQGETKGLIDEARRQASQIQQGIQSRFGGTTGTGRFVSEILGSQAMANIGKNQQALQFTLGEIGKAENNLKTEITAQISNIEQRLTDVKARLRASLTQTLADIGSQRGALEADKASQKLDALNRYQSYLQDINTRNTQLKQQLFSQFQEGASKLEQIRARAQQSYQAALNAPELQNNFSGGLPTQGLSGAAGARGSISPNEDEGILSNLGFQG